MIKSALRLASLATLALVSCLTHVEAQTSPFQAIVIQDCGLSTTLTLNEPHQGYMDARGYFCTSSSSGSGTTDTVVKSTPTSRSGTITNGGTAQVLMPSNTNRRGFYLQNQSIGDLFVNDLGTATQDQNSLKIPSGGYYASSPHQVATGALSIVGATTGQAFYAREF